MSTWSGSRACSIGCFDMTSHLHIAFAADNGELSIVVRNAAGVTLHTERRPAVGTTHHDWQALCWALQYAEAQEAKGLTLYSDEMCLKTMLERRWIVDGHYKAQCMIVRDDTYVYHLMAWRIIVGRWYGAVRFKMIERKRNVARKETQ